MENKKINNFGYLSKYNNFVGNRNVADYKIKDLIATDYNDIRIVVKKVTKYNNTYRFLFPHYNDIFENDTISLSNYNKTISGDGITGNRIHISNIGSKLKGFGLAVKIYQKMIDTFGYISTDATSTGNIQNVWRKLIDNENYTTLYYNGIINLEYCAKCVDTPNKIVCPNCKGYDFNCEYCKNKREIKCSHLKDINNREFLFISKDVNIIHKIKTNLVASKMVNPENIFIY